MAQKTENRPENQKDFLKKHDFLQTPLEKILGKKTSEKINKIGPTTIHELLQLSPRKYYKKGELTSFQELENGNYVTVQARIVSVNLKTMHARKGHILQVLITDGQDYLTATFFAKNPRMLYAHKTNLKIGENILFSGTVSTYNGIKQLVHPEFENIETIQTLETTNSTDSQYNKNLQEYIQKPIPIYPATNGFASWKVKAAIQTVLAVTSPENFENIVPKIKENPKLYTYYEAICKMHEPQTEEEYKKAKHTLKYYEAFMLNMTLKIRKHNFKQQKSLKCAENNRFTNKLLQRLPYELTNAQKRVIDEIKTDMKKEHPMQRMVLGDVGSGKTIVALIAMLAAVENGYQAIMLAPTEVLANQHYEGITNQLSDDLKTMLDSQELDDKIDINLYTAATPTATKKHVLAKLASGTPGIFIGTHALLSEKVIVNNVALVVVDEQHRFGVEQRQKLIEKSTTTPHMLSMSATPIPRSLAVTIFGDTDLSIIDEKPAGRKEIQTFLMNPNKTYIRNGIQKTWRERLWEKAREEINAGNCVYVVVPKITDSQENLNSNNKEENLRLENTKKTSAQEIISIDQAYKQIKESQALKDIQIQTLSSKTTPAEKEEIIEKFASTQAPILISTTVVEVGVDVKNATMIVIMDAERFGLATLHQLRGRVGRNDKQSYCMLVTDLEETHPSYTKLQEFTQTNDGFKIAELDLSIRKEGDILGARQSGRKSSLKFLNVIRDISIIQESLKEIEHNEKEYLDEFDTQKFEEQVENFFKIDEENYWFKN